MSETDGLVERVAKALFAKRMESAAGYSQLQQYTWEEENQPYREYCLSEAHAVIEAMREDDLRLELAKRKFNNSYTIDDDGCFVWTEAIDRRDGYGRFYDGNGKTQAAYAFAWRYYYGEIPVGMVLDHVCRNRACVNHTHLRLVTNAENVLAGEGVSARNAEKTHCIHGHPLAGENLYVRPDGARGCRLCLKAASRRSKAKKRSALHAALSNTGPGKGTT